MGSSGFDGAQFGNGQAQMNPGRKTEAHRCFRGYVRCHTISPKTPMAMTSLIWWKAAARARVARLLDADKEAYFAERAVKRTAEGASDWYRYEIGSHPRRSSAGASFIGGR